MEGKDSEAASHIRALAVLEYNRENPEDKKSSYEELPDSFKSFYEAQIDSYENTETTRWSSIYIFCWYAKKNEGKRRMERRCA